MTLAPPVPRVAATILVTAGSTDSVRAELVIPRVRMPLGEVFPMSVPPLRPIGLKEEKPPVTPETSNEAPALTWTKELMEIEPAPLKARVPPLIEVGPE